MSKSNKTQNQIVKLDNNELTDLEKRENEAYQKWLLLNEPPIPLPLAIKMYELYLSGYSVSEIHRINGEKYPIGQIVDAKIRNEWDKRKKEQLESMYSNIEERILKTKHDAINHVADALAAAHKIWGDKLKLFLQNGDIDAIAEMNLGSFKTYKELLSMLDSLTSAKETNNKTVQVQGQVTHVHEVPKKKQIASEEADDILKSLEAGEIIDVE